MKGFFQADAAFYLSSDYSIYFKPLSAQWFQYKTVKSSWFIYLWKVLKMLIMGQGAFYFVVNARLLYTWVRTSSIIMLKVHIIDTWGHKPSVTKYTFYMCVYTHR